MATTEMHPDLSVIILANKEADSLTELIPQIRTALMPLSIHYEILVVDHQADDHTRRVAADNHAVLLSALSNEYGVFLLTGIYHAAGEYIIVMDADHTHPANFICSLWQARNQADIVIGSRYITGGQAKMPLLRRLFSKMLNIVFSRGLDLRVKDMSSGFRLYKTSVVKNLVALSKDYDILQEILVKALLEGYQICEIPFTYHSRKPDPAYRRVFRFGMAYLGTFARLWRLRNSIASADYDARAYDALMPPQRYWQRQRYKHITGLLSNKGKCLDVGCGSSRIMEKLPPQSIGLDILMRKLRFARTYKCPTTQGSIFNLPFSNESFPCIICSQVIEHVPRANVLSELDRVLQPGGFLILGTPDYAKWQWVVIEWFYKMILPQSYADEHITHYTFRELNAEFVQLRGYQLEAVRYILRGELILGLRKPVSDI
jgi:dolichol-phosphate mannosyltransferase